MNLLSELWAGGVYGPPLLLDAHICLRFVRSVVSVPYCSWRKAGSKTGLLW